MKEGELKISDSCVFYNQISQILTSLNVPFSTFSCLESKIVFADFEILFSLENTSNKKVVFFLDLSEPHLEIKTLSLFADFPFIENVYFYRNLSDFAFIFTEILIKNVYFTDLLNDLNVQLVNFNWMQLFPEREHDALLLQEEYASIFNMTNAKIQDLREISLDLENAKFLIDLFNSK